MMFDSSAFIQGLGLSAGLIMAIGAQNAHVLRCGLRRQHVGVTVAACIAIDAVLICLGVAGMGVLVQASPLLLAVARWGGAAFLLWYGLRSFRAAYVGEAMAVKAAAALPVRRALLAVAALSLLNPHVYLDTVVLLGAIGGAFPAPARPSFALGAVCTSVLWFAALGYGATRLAGVFARPLAWRCIDLFTGVTMLALAVAVAGG
jgi:L-lysine exporter family protein LysE/ArgO